jgi:hypothetical protein
MKNEKYISRDFFIKSGKKGGIETAKRGKKYYQSIGKKGSQMRWNKKDELIVPFPEAE